VINKDNRSIYTLLKSVCVALLSLEIYVSSIRIVRQWFIALESSTMKYNANTNTGDLARLSLILKQTCFLNKFSNSFATLAHTNGKSSLRFLTFKLRNSGLKMMCLILSKRLWSSNFKILTKEWHL